MIQTTWFFDKDCFGKTCKVYEEDSVEFPLPVFAVVLDRGNKIGTQYVIPNTMKDVEECRTRLDMGECPLDGWEDGNGELICEENMVWWEIE